jgi:predicted PurR-regulated permease PerM
MMTYTEFVKRTLTVFGIGLFALAFWNLRSIFMIAFLSSIIAISLSIPVMKLQQYGVRRGFAIAMTLGGAVLMFALFLTWIFPVLITQMSDLGAGLPEAFEVSLDRYSDWREGQDSNLQEIFPAINRDNILETLGLEGDPQEFIAPSEVAGFALPVLANASNFLLAGIANFFLVIAVAIFMLIDPMDYAKGIITIIPPAHRKRAVEIMVELRITVTAWMAALSISISVTIFLVWLVIGGILGVPNALALGVIAGLASIIPNIGVIIPIVPLTIFTLADDPSKLPFVLGAYILIQQVEGNLISPAVVKRQLNIPAGVLFLFQIASASIFGVLGIVLAVPLLAVIITLVRELYVNDILGMEGEELEIIPTQDGRLKLITKASQPEFVKVKVIDESQEHALDDSGVFAAPD